MQARFAAGSFCVVADRGMISQRTIEALKAPGSGIQYILGCRMRRQKEVRDEVLGAYGAEGLPEVRFDRQGVHKPLVLQVKEVWIEHRRYIVCFNPEQAKKDTADRQAIVESLKEVLRTNTTYSAEEVAFQYKQLWMVEQAFRAVKSVLETRPIYHKCDDTIRGHVFCSFLALMLMKELLSRLQAKGTSLEWEDIKRDLTALREVQIAANGNRFSLRTELQGSCSQVLKAAGVAVPPTLRR